MRAAPQVALARCVGDPQAFLADAWARRPIHHTGGRFDDLLSFDDVDRILSSMSLRLPAFRLVRDGATIPTASYTRSGRIGSAPVTGIADPARIFQLFADGATIVLQGMHRFWPPLADLCGDLEMALGHPAQANAYVTPPGSRGLAVHRDSHEVFVLQAFGTKQWEVWEPGTEITDHMPVAAVKVDLQPGDSLYVPKGAPHAARTEVAASGHVTVGILTVTWADMFREVLKVLELEESFGEPLPPWFHVDPAAFEARAAMRLQDLARWVEKMDPGEAAALMTRRFLSTRASAMRGALRSVLAAGSIADDTVLRRRRRAVCHVVPDGEQLVVLLGDRRLHMPGWVEPAMRLVAQRDQLAPRDLAHLLDAESRLVLARRLVREGLLEIAADVDG